MSASTIVSEHLGESCEARCWNSHRSIDMEWLDGVAANKAQRRPVSGQV